MLDRFSQVTKNLFRGGCPSEKDIFLLKSLGINKIVSLDDRCGEIISKICDELGLEHIIWGLGDGNDPKITALKKRIIPTLTHGGPTYIHCFHGKDRTGMAVAMYRIYSGWSPGKALAEAGSFGMGLNLDPETTRSYYNAVQKYANELEEDKSNALDAVSVTRENNSFGPQGLALNDSTISRPINELLPPATDREFSHLSRIAKNAALKIFRRCNSADILKPEMWFGSKSQVKNSFGKLFSAKIISSSEFETIDKPINDTLLKNIRLKSIDVAILRDDQYFILNPNVLIDIQEEDDINNIIDVGIRDNSIDYPLAYNGSGSGLGGMPDGAAGFVQLPFSGPGTV